MKLIRGQTILGYTIKYEIGEGAHGKVYLVEKSNIAGTTTRALKVITLPREEQYVELLNSMGGNKKKVQENLRYELEKILEEVRLFSMVSEKNNQNIVTYHENDVEQVDDYRYNIYILMEYLTPLNQWLMKNDLTVRDGINIFKHICEALKVCHENEIVHRDIKIGNIFVTADRNFKLGDFGIAKRFDVLTKTNTIKGTPQYIAPEIYLSSNPADNSVDIYSLGIVMYYLFNKNRFPYYPNFPENYTGEDVDKAFYKRMKYLPLNNPVCAPEEISRIIKKCLDKPQYRYREIEAVLEDLEKVEKLISEEALEQKINPDLKEMKEGETSESIEGEGLQISFTKSEIPKKKKKFQGIILLCLILGVIAVGIVWVFRRPETEKKPEVLTTIVGVSESTTEAIPTEEKTAQEETISYFKLENYTGEKYKTVKKKLEQFGIKVRIKRKYHNKIKKGRIVAQSISGGNLLRKGTILELTVSRGKRQIEATETIQETTRYQNSLYYSTKNTQKQKEKKQQKEPDFGDVIE